MKPTAYDPNVQTHTAIGTAPKSTLTPTTTRLLVEALNDAHDFVDCDKSHKNPEIATYAKRVCDQIKEALAAAEREMGEL